MQERAEDDDDDEEPPEQVEGENDGEEVVEGGDEVDEPELPEEVAELGELEVAGQEGDDAQAGEAEDEPEVVGKEEEEEEEAQAGEFDDGGGGGKPASDDWSDWSSRDPVLTLSFESKLLLDSGFKCDKVALHCPWAILFNLFPTDLFVSLSTHCQWLSSSLFVSH